MILVLFAVAHNQRSYVDEQHRGDDKEGIVSGAIRKYALFERNGILVQKEERHEKVEAEFVEKEACDEPPKLRADKWWALSMNIMRQHKTHLEFVVNLVENEEERVWRDKTEVAYEGDADGQAKQRSGDNRQAFEPFVAHFDRIWCGGLRIHGWHRSIEFCKQLSNIISQENENLLHPKIYKCILQ